MAESTPGEDVKASINEELRKHYQRYVDAYRPDLKGDKPPGEPIFQPMNPCHLREERENDPRECNVADLLTLQLQEGTDVLPRRVLVLGRPESGKTALFGQILHYWLHDKKMMAGLKDFDFLLAVQCLGLASDSKKDEEGSEKDGEDSEKALEDSKKGVEDSKKVLEKHMLDHLPESIKKYDEETVRQGIRSAKVLIMIDSLDCLEEGLISDTSLTPWSDSRVIIFCRYKFLKDHATHAFNSDQSKDNLVLKLRGGMPVNPFHSTGNTPEKMFEFGGVFSGELLEKYCRRLCKCRNTDFDQFWKYYTEILQYFSLDMRKPFNIYMAMEAFCGHVDLDAKTVSELYRTWFEIWSKLYRTTVHKSDSDPADITVKGTSFLTKLVYEAFDSNREYLSREDITEGPELLPFLAHFLMPHYNPQGEIEKFTFRIAAHKFFLAAKHSVTKIDVGMGNVTNILNTENFKKLESFLPMILGVAKGSNSYEKIQRQALEIAKHNLEDHVTKPFNDPIINYAVTVLSETKVFSKKGDAFDPFVTELVGCLRPSNWSIVDGNMHPEALRTLCLCGHDNKDPMKRIPQRLNISLSGSPADMPGLHHILEAVKDCDMRVNFSNDYSFLNEEGKFPLDDAVSVMQGKGQASLSSFSGYLKDINKLDTDPATRRIYKISLRICSHNEYESLRELCKNSHKLTQVVLRISNTAVKEITKKVKKELPANVSKLRVFLEDFTDDNVDDAIKIWKSIQGTTKRYISNLWFWVNKEEKMTVTGVKKVIDADLSGTKIELSLGQPVSDLDKQELQKALNDLKEKKYVIRLLGSAQYERIDMIKDN